MSSFTNDAITTPTYTDLGIDSTGARLLQGPDGKVMKAYDWHRTQLTMDLVVTDTSTGSIALIKRGAEPFKDSFALPGGFADLVKGEDIDETVLREAREEINFMGGTVTRATFRANAHRDPRGYTATCVYTINVTSREGFKAGDDAAALFWIPINVLMELTQETAKTFAPFSNNNVCGFAFDHLDILQEVLSRNVPV